MPPAGDKKCEGQHAVKKATRKSKKSWELMTESWLTSAAGLAEKKAARKSKKSWELRSPSWLKSPAQVAPWYSIAPMSTMGVGPRPALAVAGSSKRRGASRRSRVMGTPGRARREGVSPASMQEELGRREKSLAEGLVTGEAPGR